MVHAVLISPIVGRLSRMPECEFKRTAICPLPSALLINVVSTDPCIAGASAVHSFLHILVDCVRGDGRQVAVFLLAESFSLVPRLGVGAPVVAVVIMRLPVVSAALKKSAKSL